MSEIPSHQDPHLELNKVPQAVNEVLSEYLDRRRAELARIGGPAEEAFDHLNSFVLGGGKRIRPLFAWAGYLAGSHERGQWTENPRSVLEAVSALEFIQACALVHDDIIDGSDTRRGAPATHRAVEKQHSQRRYHGDSAHFGESIAILLGDIALAWADDMVNDSGLSPAALQRIRGPWRAMRTEVIGGQILDVCLEASGSEDALLARNVSRYKTAAYTIERPLHIGAAIAGGSEELIRTLRGFGEDVGVAFQLRDDLLGVFGDPDVTGKPAGDDIREGKRTELLSIALAHADASNHSIAEELRARVGVADEPEEVQHLVSLIEETGAPCEIEKRITVLTERGLSQLEGAGLPDDVTQILTDLAAKATQRTS